MFQRLLASIVLGFVATNTVLGTSTALALTQKTTAPMLRPGSITVSSAVSAKQKLTYKQKVVLANAMVQSAKANKKSLSFVQAMRNVNASTITPLTMVNAIVLSDRRKRIEAMNGVRKAKSTTTPIVTTSTPTPVVILSSAPVVPVSSGGGGGSTSISSSSSSSSVSAPSSSTPVVTTSTPISPAPSSSTPTVAPTAPATPVVPTGTVAPTTPTAPTVPATPTAPATPVVASTGTTAPAFVVPTVPVTPTPMGSTPLTISNPQDANLAKLSEYQHVMGGFVADHLMIFMNMPQSQAAIEGASYYMANIMEEYARSGVTPIFVFEPTGDSGNQLDLGKLKNGDYSANMESLFSMIKNDRKVTEDKLGVMIPYPEINTPAFDRANFAPTDLPTMVNIFFDSIRKSYPNVKGGLLLDAKSYDVNQGWGQGSARSFAPYVTGIKPGYVQDFVLQGFPWASNDASTKVYDPTVFLPTGIAEEAATLLGTKNIWFNTGTARKQYQSNTVTVTPAERTTTMNGIISQASKLQAKGYSVLVHIFAQDKFSMGEGIDWSYIENAGDGTLSAHESVFASFLTQAQAKGIKVGLFDR